MKTIVTESPSEAAAFIRAGGIAAFPTETVYGLGANVFDNKAIAKVFEAKGRPSDNPLIVHVSNTGQIQELASGVTETAQILIDRFFPGPLTIVVEKSNSVPKSATAGLNTVAVRMPNHPLAQTFIEACESPVVAPSANLSGRPSPTSWQSVVEDLDGLIDCVLKGDTTRFGLESTVVDCSGAKPLVLRTGAITLEQLREVFDEITVAETSDSAIEKSPGLKHQHYSPRAKVRIIQNIENDISEDSIAYIGVSKPTRRYERVQVCESVNAYARTLYEFFRQCDRDHISTIHCEEVAEEGIGMALMDRIRRAASG